MGRFHAHQGIDIFAGTDINITPVIAAYPGYLTTSARLEIHGHCACAERPAQSRNTNLAILHPHGRPVRELIRLG